MGKKQIIEIRKKIIRGLEEAYKSLVEYKKQKNTPLIISKDGEVVEIQPNEILPTTIYKRH